MEHEPLSVFDLTQTLDLPDPRRGRGSVVPYGDKTRVLNPVPCIVEGRKERVVWCSVSTPSWGTPVLSGVGTGPTDTSVVLIKIRTSTRGFDVVRRDVDLGRGVHLHLQ